MGEGSGSGSAARWGRRQKIRRASAMDGGAAVLVGGGRVRISEGFCWGLGVLRAAKLEREGARVFFVCLRPEWADESLLAFLGQSK